MNRKIWARLCPDPTLRTYIRDLFSVMPGQVMLTLALMVALSLTEGVGLLLLIPLLQLVGLDVQQGSMGELARLIAKAFSALGMQPSLITVLGVYVLIISLQALLTRWEQVASFTLNQNFVVYLQQKLYQAIAHTHWLFFCRNRASDFTHALTDETARVGGATYFLLSVLVNSIFTTVYILLALRLSVVMTGLVFGCGLVLLLLLKGRNRLVRTAGEQLSEATNDLYAAVTEHLTGMKTVKSYGAEDRNITLFNQITHRVAQQEISANHHYVAVQLWLKIGSVLLLSIILYVGLKSLTLSTSSILLLLFLFTRIMPRFSSIQQNFQYFLNAIPAFANVKALQRRCEAAAEPNPIAVHTPVELNHSIHLENVCFSYHPTAQSPVVQNLDLVISASQTTAMVGPSGAGKSTVADLVMGLISPTQGQILIDGSPLNFQCMSAWRQQISYVAQETFLFNDTVRANLLWACPEASQANLEQALYLAAADGFVSRLPHRMETRLGDRGVRLSGGEKQRLALARALLRQPSLLILDEATSALDTENEQWIQNTIEHLHGQMTILVIAHRLSTIRWADRIHVLERGSLVESGNWEQLIRRENGRFLALCQAQSIQA